MSAKKVRLILVNNPTASLFMASWFKQNNYDQGDEWRNIGVYTTIDLSESFSENIDEKKRAYEMVSCEPLQEMIDFWLTCCPHEYDNYRFELGNLSDAFRERNKRTEDIKRIYKIFKLLGIQADHVQEVWLTSNSFSHHFKFVCSKAKFIYFEHGLSDIKYMLQSNGFNHSSSRINNVQQKKTTVFRYAKNVMKSWYYHLNNYFEDKITLFKKDFRIDEYVSVMGDEIQSVQHIANLRTLRRSKVLELGARIVNNDLLELKAACSDGQMAIILMESIKPFASGKENHLNFFKEFEQYILDNYANFFLRNGVKHILFKPRFFFEEHTQEAFKAFELLRKQFKLLFLPDYVYKNYPVEFYLSGLQPRIILGVYSSGLFYSKKLVKNLDIYSYDKWYIEYCDKHFKIFHSDYLWLRPFFESKKMISFKDYVPRSL